MIRKLCSWFAWRRIRKLFRQKKWLRHEQDQRLRSTQQAIYIGGMAALYRFGCWQVYKTGRRGFLVPANDRVWFDSLAVIHFMRVMNPKAETAFVTDYSSSGRKIAIWYRISDRDGLVWQCGNEDKPHNFDVVPNAFDKLMWTLLVFQYGG